MTSKFRLYAPFVCKARLLGRLSQSQYKDIKIQIYSKYNKYVGKQIRKSNLPPNMTLNIQKIRKVLRNKGVCCCVSDSHFIEKTGWVFCSSPSNYLFIYIIKSYNLLPSLALSYLPACYKGALQFRLKAVVNLAWPLWIIW